MKNLCHRMAVASFDVAHEPFSPFDDHSPELLESALNAPRATFGGKEFYQTLAEKAAVLYYHLIKNHPFGNGNKRVATASLFVFLFLNDHWLLVKETELVEKAIYVAESRPIERESVVTALTEWVDSNLASRDNWRSKIKQIASYYYQNP